MSRNKSTQGKSHPAVIQISTLDDITYLDIQILRTLLRAKNKNFNLSYFVNYNYPLLPILKVGYLCFLLFCSMKL